MNHSWLWSFDQLLKFHVIIQINKKIYLRYYCTTANFCVSIISSCLVFYNCFTALETWIEDLLCPNSLSYQVTYLAWKGVMTRMLALFQTFKYIYLVLDKNWKYIFLCDSCKYAQHNCVLKYYSKIEQAKYPRLCPQVVAKAFLCDSSAICIGR